MQLQYSQGLIRGQTDPSSSAKLFLQKSATNVSIYVTDMSLQAVLAHKDKNYIIEEPANVGSAWTVPPGACWLYWDIDLATGVVTRGTTQVEPLFGPMTPPDYIGIYDLQPVNDMHFFNTLTRQHYVYDEENMVWVEKLRVFAGQVDENGVLTAKPYASQVGLVGATTAGYILRNIYGEPIVSDNGTFMNTGTGYTITTGSNVPLNVSLDATTVFALAAEPLPELIAVAPDSTGGWVPANGPTGKMAIGITVNPVAQGVLFKPATYGVIRHDQFFFDVADIGKTVWLGANGELLTTRPFGYIGQALGTVMATDAMFLNMAISLPPVGGSPAPTPTPSPTPTPAPAPAPAPTISTTTVRALLYDYSYSALNLEVMAHTPFKVSSAGRFGIKYDGTQNQFRNWFQPYPNLISVGYELIDSSTDLPITKDNPDIELDFVATQLGVIDQYPVIEGYLVPGYKPGSTSNNYTVTINVVMTFLTLTPA